MRHMRYTAATDALRPGYQGETIDFSYKPYAERGAEQRQAMDALRNDIADHGIRNPLITKSGRVLIGMRRWEIAMEQGIPTVECIELLEDVDRWMAPDVARLKSWITEVTDTSVPAYAA